MKFLNLAVFAAIALLPAASHAEQRMAKVNATNTIRCGYVSFDPGMVKNEAGEWVGFDVEVMQAVAHRLELKIEYTAETGWGTVVADLNASKFDMLCSGFWVHPNVGKFALFARPHYFQPVFVIARADDARFAKGIPDLNDKALRFIALDGDNPVAIAQADFPKVQMQTLPAMTNFSETLLNVADKKADFTVTDAVAFGIFNKNNPGKLKIVDPAKPIRIYPASFVVGAEDAQFRDAIDAALNELILDGTIDRIMDKYDKYPNAYYRATVPYRNPYVK